jgi:hypothetical protein
MVNYFEHRDFQALGLEFLNKVTLNFENGLITESFIYLQESFKYIISVVSHIPLNLPRPAKLDFKTDLEYKFCIAFALSYRGNDNNLGLSYINSFLSYFPRDSFGYFIKGKLLKLNREYDGALECFLKSDALGSSPSCLFELGKLKETNFNLFGLNHFYDAYVLNPSSLSAFLFLKEYSVERDVFKLMTFNSSNILINCFSREFNRDDHFGFIDKKIQELFAKFYNSSYTPFDANFVNQQFFELQLFLNANRSTFTQENFLLDYQDYLKYISIPDLELEVVPEDLHIEDSRNFELQQAFDQFFPDLQSRSEAYFDAMTDGQLGSYWDFEGGENYIGDWAGN